MNRVNYDQRLYRHFHEGRAHDESVMLLWRDTIRRAIGEVRGMTILDLGSGTGRFSGMLAEEFDARVVGVEPSEKMRKVAEANCTHPGVRFLAGSAENIPLDDQSCDVAWLSQIVHHLSDLERAARELRRVVRPSGIVIIRSNFAGRLAGFCRYYEFFPSGLVVDEARHPSVEQLRASFERNSFVLRSFDTIQQQEADSLQEYAERIRMRTYSTFELISEADFAAGLRAMDAAVQSERQPQAVTAKLDLLVFARRQESSGGQEFERRGEGLP